MLDFDLTGRLALVTGGGRGIGRGISLMLAAHGADLAVIYRSNREAAEDVAEKARAMGRRANVFQWDMSRVEGMREMAESVRREAGPIHALVNNAGTADLESVFEVSEESWDRVMNVNLKGPFFLAQAAARLMAREKVEGRIINISSTNGFLAEAHLSAYNASKGGLELLTKSLAIELAPYKITCNSVAPGLIETEIGEDFEVADGFWEHVIGHIPAGRLGSPEECAGAVVLLASDAGRYITGQHIVVDGGLICDQVPRLRFCPPPSLE